MLAAVGMTPLNMACNRRNSAIAKMLISANAIVNLADATGNLPLHYIARSGDLRVATLLLNAGILNPRLTDDMRGGYVTIT